MRGIDMTTECRGADVPTRDRLYVHGKYAYADNGHLVLGAVDEALAEIGLEIVYGVNPGDDAEIMIIVDQKKG